MVKECFCNSGNYNTKEGIQVCLLMLYEANHDNELQQLTGQEERHQTLVLMPEFECMVTERCKNLVHAFISHSW